MDGFPHSQIGPAAAQISVHGRIDILVRRLGVLRQKRSRGHNLTGLTIAALRHVNLLPGYLQRVRTKRGQSFDGGNGGMRRAAHRRQAGTNRLAGEMDGTGATLTNATTVLRSMKVKNIAEYP